MSDDWQPGDLALCVKTAPEENRFRTSWIAVVGGVYTVSEVCWLVADGSTLLEFEEDTDRHPDAAWEAHLFRKIRPHTEDEEDRETIRLLTTQPEPAEA